MYYKSACIMYVHVLSAQRLEECQALELDLQLVVSHHVGPENQSEACYKDNHVLWLMYHLSSSNLTGFKNTNPDSDLKHPKNCSNFILQSYSPNFQY